MESDSDDGFGRKPAGDALEIGDDQFDDSEDQNQMSDEEEEINRPPLAQNKPKPAPPKAQVKGEIVQNEHHDLAVDVNDSEEIDSEEDDEVQMN